MTTIDHFLSNENGKGSFSADIEPVLRIKPGTGETIGFETDDEVYDQLYEGKTLDQITAQINPVTGPVYVEGAEPGDTLVVHIHDIELTEFGYSVYLPGAGALAERMGEDQMARRIPVKDSKVTLLDGVEVDALPMIGCIGTAPAAGEGSVVMPSFANGGNMDLTDAKPGSTVYLPVDVPGALLSIGDIHAIMSRGESSFVAIEAQGTAIVSVDLIKGVKHRAPRIETEDEWIFIGLGNPVQESIQRGYEDIFDLLVEDNGYSREDAYVVMSALAHSELGGPTGSEDPDPLHPFTAIGAVTVHRLPKSLLT